MNLRWLICMGIFILAGRLPAAPDARAVFGEDEAESSEYRIEDSPYQAMAFSRLAEVVHEKTFDLIKAETMERQQAFGEALKALFNITQVTLERLQEHPEQDELTRQLERVAIQLDRIDYAHHLQKNRSVSHLVGELPPMIMKLERQLAEVSDSPPEEEEPTAEDEDE